MRFLVTADWHIRGTVPSCVDATPKEWMNLQKEALRNLLRIAEENAVQEILVGGDLFHSDASTTFECIHMLQHFALACHDKGIEFWVMAGNHDLPYHSSENISKSAIGVLMGSDEVKHMHFNSHCKGSDFDIEDYGDAEVIFKHVLCIPREDKPDFIDCKTPDELLSDYPHARLIFTGDYHKNFVYEQDGRKVVNSGCLLRQAIDFRDYDPGVYVVDTSDDSAVFHSVRVEQKFTEDRDIKKERDEMIETFVNGISRQEVTLDFISSLKHEAEKQNPSIKEKVEEWIESSGQ